MLLVILWARSYSREDIVTWGSPDGSGFMFGTKNGELSTARFPSRKGAVSEGWCIWSNPANETRMWQSPKLAQLMGVRYKFFPRGTIIIVAPVYLPLLSFAMITVASASRIRWRYSLRTLLIATTVIVMVIASVVARKSTN